MGEANPDPQIIGQNLEIPKIPRKIRKILNVGIVEKMDTIRMSARIPKKIRMVTIRPMQILY